MNVGVTHTSTPAPVGAFSNFGWFGLACPASYNITADTQPDCDEYGPDCYWSAAEWIKLHQEKLKKYGKAKADADWGTAWASCRGIGGAFGHELSIANNDLAFIQYFSQQGLYDLVPDLKMIKATGKISGTVVNTAVQAANTVENIGSTIENTAKSASTIAKWLPYILIGALAAAAFIFYKIQTK